MLSFQERIQEVINSRNATRRFKEMEELTGVGAKTWTNISYGKQKANQDHLEALFKAFPQYACWLATGITREEVGDTSPILERIQEDLRKAGRDAA